MQDVYLYTVLILDFVWDLKCLRILTQFFIFKSNFRSIFNHWLISNNVEKKNRRIDRKIINWSILHDLSLLVNLSF